jgi:nucleotide-binding universal stress UspA family protein
MTEQRSEAGETSTSDVRPVIVVGVDCSAASVAALRFGGRLAIRLGARVRAITAWSEPPAFARYPAMGVNADAYAEEGLVVAVRDAFEGQPPADLTREAIHGHPAHVLITASRDAFLLIVGSRGHGGVSGALLGSVSSACAEHGKCPVLVFHAGPKVPVGAAEAV